MLGLTSFCLETRILAVMDRPYNKGINTVGAVCDRAMFKLESFETETNQVWAYLVTELMINAD
jgi:hypothetical protein